MNSLRMKYFALLAVTALLSLSSITAAFAAWAMFAIRRVFGRGAYLCGMCVIIGALFIAREYMLGAMVLSLAVLIGVETEVEDHGGSIFYSGAISVLSSLGVIAFGAGCWKYLTKGSVIAALKTQLVPVVDRMAEVGTGGASITIDDVIQQIPSAITVYLMLVLAVALIWGPRLATWVSGTFQGTRRESLIAFRVPDFAVWLAIVTLLGAFLKQSPSTVQAVAINVLNVLVVIYFFQGLAIVTHAFRAFRVTPFWQSLWYFIFVIQLFLMVAVLGFADFWLDFRDRLARREIGAKKAGRIDKEI